MIVGDSNVVNEKSEKYGWRGCHAFENEFSRWILEMEMLDHPYVGSLLSWSNIREGDGFLARKLDRALLNDLWPSTFAQTMVEFLPPGVYDHAAMSTTPPKPFKFLIFGLIMLVFLILWSRLGIKKSKGPLCSYFIRN